MNDIQTQAKEAADRLENVSIKDATALYSLLLARKPLRRIERGELAEVVRCGECMHYADVGLCELGQFSGERINRHQFCSNGETAQGY